MINEWVTEGINAYVAGKARVPLGNARIAAWVNEQDDVDLDALKEIGEFFRMGWDFAQAADTAIAVFENASGGRVRG
jgi:hypothetical protein